MIKRILVGIALFLGATALIFAELLLGILLFEGSALIWGVLARVCALALLIALAAMSIISLIKMSRFSKERFSTAQNMYDSFMEKREDVKESFEESRAKMEAIARRSLGYIALFVALVNLFLFFSTGAMAYAQDVLGIVLVGIAAIFCPVTMMCLVFRYIESRPRVSFSEYEEEEDYPEIYALARRAAERMGIDKEIKIVFILDNTVGVAQIDGKISLQIGAPVLAYLTKNELYPIFLHEFSHIRDESRELKLNRALSDFFGKDRYIFDIALLYTGFRFCYEYEMYSVFSNIMVEENADRSMALDGNAQNAANSLAKIAVYDGFSGALDMNMGVPFYENDGVIKSYCTTLLSRFFELLPSRRAEWESVIELEIQSRSATHPLIRERIAMLGVSSYDTSAPDDKGSGWREECDRAIEGIDKEFYENISPRFESEREIYYLEPKSSIDEWERAGRAYSSESIRGVVDDLISLCRWDEALSLCDLIIERETGGLRDYAYHTRGNVLYMRRDARAIPDLYAAIKGNTNYTDDINLIGELCCKLGLKDELEVYRDRSVGIIQDKMDSDGIDELCPSDELTDAGDLPREIYKRNLDRILEAGEGSIRRVYLVKKTMEKGIYSYVYVIEFEKKGSEPQLIRKCMEKIFEHLDNSPEDIQYSLFFYNSEHAAAVRSVKESCIFDSKKEGK